MYLSGETEAYQASSMATLPDFCIAVVAALVALALLLGKKPAGVTACEKEEIASPSEAQHVLDELVPDAHTAEPDDHAAEK